MSVSPKQRKLVVHTRKFRCLWLSFVSQLNFMSLELCVLMKNPKILQSSQVDWFVLRKGVFVYYVIVFWVFI